MTKEEYEKLLQTDYWKGYSYSLIKERNFTCEDCGRSFFNERNKLQVHHLVYRDTNPWSYKPEELVVLCEDCHKKRHGIYVEPEPDHVTTNKNEPSGGYSKSYSYSNDIKDEGVSKFNLFGILSRLGRTRLFRGKRNSHAQFIKPTRLLRGFKLKYVYRALILLFVWFFVKGLISSNEGEPSEGTNVVSSHSEDRSNSGLSKNRSHSSKVSDEELPQSENSTAIVNDTIDELATSSDFDESVAIAPEKIDVEEEDVTISEGKSESNNSEKELSTSEILEIMHHEDVVKQAKKAGVSTEGTTTEILERITHADVVKQAKKAGVSTEGTTTEILERITHADVVKQAKKAGVSAEGTTTEILERITHADVVKQAKKAGVSTEGTTTEILERITHAEVVKQAKKAGVSTN